jgi:hypothetical protein
VKCFARIKVFVVAASVALILTSGALAATRVPPAYLGVGGNVQSQVQGAQEGANTLGSLPFTGLDLSLIAGGGLLLLISGATVRRLAKRRA